MRSLAGVMLLLLCLLAAGCSGPAGRQAPAPQGGPAAAPDSAMMEQSPDSTIANPEPPQARLERLIRYCLEKFYLDSAYIRPFCLKPGRELPRRTSMHDDSGYTFSEDDENYSGFLTDSLLRTAEEIYGPSDIALLPWLNLEAEHFINLRKLYDADNSDLGQARQDIERADRLLESSGVGKKEPARQRIDLNIIYLKYFSGDLPGTADALRDLIPALTAGKDRRELSLALELSARCRLGIGPGQQYCVNGFRFYEPEQYKTFLDSLDRNYASETLGLLQKSRDLLSRNAGESSLEMQTVLELMEDCYLILNRRNDYLLTLERRLFENYCHCPMDCEDQVYQMINIVYDNVAKTDLQKRLNALNTYHPIYVSSDWQTQNWEPYTELLTESYKAWIMNLEERKNRSFRERYNDVVSQEERR